VVTRLRVKARDGGFSIAPVDFRDTPEEARFREEVRTWLDASLPDEYFEKFLGVIERAMHSRKNRVRHQMNGALIAIGIRNPALEKKAVAAAERIGKVEVDHGETGCKTPDAVPYIRRAVERKKK